MRRFERSGRPCSSPCTEPGAEDQVERPAGNSADDIERPTDLRARRKFRSSAASSWLKRLRAEADPVDAPSAKTSVFFRVDRAGFASTVHLPPGPVSPQRRTASSSRRVSRQPSSCVSVPPTNTVSTPREGNLQPPPSIRARARQAARCGGRNRQRREVAVAAPVGAAERTRDVDRPGFARATARDSVAERLHHSRVHRAAPVYRQSRSSGQTTPSKGLMARLPGTGSRELAPEGGLRCRTSWSWSPDSPGRFSHPDLTIRSARHPTTSTSPPSARRPGRIYRREPPRSGRAVPGRSVSVMATGPLGREVGIVIPG